MIILKLGGSVITRKNASEPTLDTENLTRICREISESSYENLIVVHGAGSYGHLYAKEYEIGAEINSKKELERKKQGFSKTQNSVKDLNAMVCEHLQKQGIATVSIQPSSFIKTENKRIIKADLDLIKQYLELGFVPVIYGDVVLDANEKIKMAVVSGDQLIKYLAENLKPELVVLGSDVDGVYNQDPKDNPDAELIKVVRSRKDLLSLDSTKTVDVTGGMGGKIDELLEIAKNGIESEIINANTNNNIKRALNGEKEIGTLIR
ncbi:aspartate/glutamate/uridylate kinase [Methanobacterium lacus]|uniref:Isopentenyl phosphate kinase n=1 Tax=Methanobacterium lacus (strain AL-21) TaxID=877455 RepID=F0TBB9_METLA|nr:isopentenyl phosphate kinase [Methanobacterium lacus]ADZ09070.1 aspartate/glutamate/uridylate kinase [Methanobacterium lacus]